MKKYTEPQLHAQLPCRECGKTGGVRKQKNLGANLPKHLAVNVAFAESDGGKKKGSIDVPVSAQYLHKYIHNPPAHTGYKLVAFIENEQT